MTAVYPRLSGRPMPEELNHGDPCLATGYGLPIRFELPGFRVAY
jgi:hypothetical protein